MVLRNSAAQVYSKWKRDGAVEAGAAVLSYLRHRGKRLSDSLHLCLLRFVHGRYVERNVFGNTMRLDIDTHLGRRLVVQGMREEYETRDFRATLMDLREENERPICLFDIGASNGYYSLMAAGILDADDRVIAIDIN